mmetsp:Transcript_22232/g.51139  ORF Transcript_22232/g.51139 Transcript_22232/m.51139 type:complete len:274 (-) Transcript_22232:2469-3290(-)
MAAHLTLQLLPLAVTKLVGHAHEEAVLLLGEELAAVVAVLDRQRLPRRVARGDLLAQRVGILRFLGDLALALLNLLGTLVEVRDHAGPSLPKCGRVGAHLIERLGTNLVGDLLQLVAAMPLARLEELGVVVARPRGEALRLEPLALRELRLLLLADGGGLGLWRRSACLGGALHCSRALDLALVLRLVQLGDALVVEELEVLHVRQLLRLGQPLLNDRLDALCAREIALRIRGVCALALADGVLHHLHESHIAVLVERLVVDAVELLEVDLGV